MESTRIGNQMAAERMFAAMRRFGPQMRDRQHVVRCQIEIPQAHLPSRRLPGLKQVVQPAREKFCKRHGERADVLEELISSLLERFPIQFDR